MEAWSHHADLVLPVLSWEAWLQVPSVSAAARTIFGKGPAFALTLGAEAVHPTLTWTTTTAGAQTTTLVTDIVGAGWVHVAFTYDGLTWRAFVNGVVERTGELPDTVVTSASALVFGHQAASGTQWYDGQLDEVALYPYALSPAQVAAHYARRVAAGTGAIPYAIVANATGALRTATVTVAGVAVPVNQAAAGQLAIAGYVSPLPNAQGWHTGPVTVSFVCAGPGTITCPPPVLVDVDGVREVLGTALNDLDQTATVAVTVRIDRTPPFVTIASPALHAIVPVGALTMAGVAGDALSEAIVTCDGQAATMAGGAFTCDTTVPVGGATVVIVATDAAGNTIAVPVDLATPDTIAIEPTSLRLTPQQVTMVLGETRAFGVRDNQGRVPTDAVWTVDHPTVATLSTDPMAALTAVGSGEATLTVAWRGLTATTVVTVLSVSVAPPGTTLWAVPPIGGAVREIVQATTVEGERRTYVIESPEEVGAPDTIRGFTADGREVWSANAGGRVAQLSGDPLGGAVATIVGESGVLRVFRPDGRSVDRPASAWTFAIDPAGPLYMVSGSELLSIDIGLGVGGRVALPLGTATTCTGGTVEAAEGCTSVPAAYRAGTPTVLADGRVVVPVDTSEYITIAQGPGADISWGSAAVPQLSLVFLHPDHTTQVQTVAYGTGVQHATWRMSPLKAIPNGHGGVLIGVNATRHVGLETYRTWSVVGVNAAGTVTALSGIGGEVTDLLLGDTGALAIATLGTSGCSARSPPRWRGARRRPPHGSKRRSRNSSPARAERARSPPSWLLCRTQSGRVGDTDEHWRIDLLMSHDATPVRSVPCSRSFLPLQILRHQPCSRAAETAYSSERRRGFTRESDDHLLAPLMLRSDLQ